MAYRWQSAALALFLIAFVAGAVAGPAAAAATGATAGNSWRTIRFGGISLRTPSAWPVVNLARHPRTCPRLNRHAVYLGVPGPDPACPASATGKTGAVQILTVRPASPDARLATKPAVVAGQPARTTTDSAITHTIVDIIPAAGMEVSLSYGNDLSTIRQVQSSIHLVRSTARPRPRTAAASRPATVPAPLPAQGLVTGAGFDTCAAPSAATMRTWLKSPYRAIGVYIGGINRGCAQANLSNAWLKTVLAEGWHYWPYYVGLQADCVQAYGDATIVPAKAAAEGTAAAQDAVTQARSLGIPAGTPITYDMEAYGGCGQQVVTFLSAWDRGLHAAGYLAGVYESFSNVGDLISAAGTMTEPDVINYADWDGKATTASTYMPATMWTSHQRLHQYLGGHNVSYGGATLNIDNDQLDVRLSGTHSVLPPPGFGIAVGMNRNGTAEWFARAASGALLHAYQHPVGSTDWAATRTVGDSPRNLVSNPAVVSDQDGALTLFAVSSAGTVTHAWQQAGQPDDWEWGGAAGTGSPGQVTGDPAAVTEPGGAVGVFVTDTNGAIMSTRQTSPNANASWTAWTPIGGRCASSPVPVAVGSSVLVACTTRRGTFAVATLTGSAVSAWQQAGTATRLVSRPTVLTEAGGTVELFGTTKAGQVVTEYRQPGQAGWTQSSVPAGQRASGNPAVISWPGGGAAIVSQVSGGQAAYAVRSGPAGSAWSAWASLGAAMAGGPAAWRDTSGEPQAAILTPGRQLAVSAYPGGSWAPWAEVASGF